MNNEKAIYLKQWKDQEKRPDFEPVLIEILDKLESLEKENAELKKAYVRNIEAMTGQISSDLLSEIKKHPTALPYICELRKEIERLEKENSELKNKPRISVSMGNLESLLEENQKIEQEIQATKEQLEKADSVINVLLENVPHYDECSFIDDEEFDCDCGREIDIKSARQYFKQKDEVKCE